MAANALPPVFEIELKPYRSLGPRGFAILMILFGLVNFAAGIAFWMLGAWPVFGFFGLDVLLVWLAFRFSYAQARAREIIRLDQDALEVRRIDARGNERPGGCSPTGCGWNAMPRTMPRRCASGAMAVRSPWGLS